MVVAAGLPCQSGIILGTSISRPSTLILIVSTGGGGAFGSTVVSFGIINVKFDKPGVERPPHRVRPSGRHRKQRNDRAPHVSRPPRLQVNPLPHPGGPTSVARDWLALCDFASLRLCVEN